MSPLENRTGSEGFTLIEVLISLVLLAMLSVALMAAFQFASLALSRTGPHAAAIAAVDNSQTALRRWLSAAYPEYVPAQVSGLPGQIIFEGEPATITFLTPAPMTMEPGGFALMQVQIIGGPENRSLVVTAQPELAWPNGHTKIQETLLPRIASAHFAFLGADSPATQPYWHDTWAGKETLPRLIRIQVAFNPGDLRLWPDLFIAPLIRVDENCLFSQMLNGCVGR